MKPTTLFAVAALVVAGPLAKAATPSPATTPAPRAEVVYVEPEKFTDVRRSYSASESDRDDILGQLREYFVEEGRRLLPEGNKVYITVTDVDMAGDFEPWHGARWDDVRIVKDIYPPKLNLSFRLTDASGNVLKEGSRMLRDLSFMYRMPVTFRDDSLKYEKTLIDDWFHSEFRDVLKK